MKKNIIILGTIVLVIIAVIVFSYGKKIKLLYNSLNGFKNENLAYTFQNMYKIQPKKQIEKGDTIYKFEKEISPLPESFYFKGESYSINDFLTDTHTSGLLVIKDDIIKHESYYLGADENTLFSSNSMGKSFVSALMGIAISEGYISSVNDPIGKYIPEFKNTEIESIPIKACLQMASGINFDEDNDMSKYSIRTLLGASAMKLISKVGLNEEPYTHRRYLSINTEILGEIIRNTTGYSLSKYMEEKLWKKIGIENDAYWTLNNEKELAMGGLCASLRDYARFARLYLNNGKWGGSK